MKPDVKSPVFSTPNSACFDIHAYLNSDDVLNCYDVNNIGFNECVTLDSVVIHPNNRVLIPTGLILDIPNGFSVRLHPRSGLSLKRGIVLANSEGIIDSDYVEPLFVILQNVSNIPIVIYTGDRICQGELVESLEYELFESGTAPEQKTIRSGGFGSTGN